MSVFLISSVMGCSMGLQSYKLWGKQVGERGAKYIAEYPDEFAQFNAL